ncbi:2855_t:CDS:2 [Ambispora leptoticha]|uniref:2855_t:CDS:1 n=1 Tax=Ambispora leptoticha TaxID=144679 RepID=A0A9N8ZNR0_9GLOM|nr:2855_t:CDS:2 [Ambispora leptoticha]
MLEKRIHQHNKGSTFSSIGAIRSQTPSSDIQQDKCLQCCSSNPIYQNDNLTGDDDREDVISFCWCTDDEETPSTMEQQVISKTDCSSEQKETNESDLQVSNEVTIVSNKMLDVTVQGPVKPNIQCGIHTEQNKKQNLKGRVVLTIDKLKHNTEPINKNDRTTNTMAPTYNSQLEVKKNTDTTSFEDLPLIESYQYRVNLFKNRKELVAAGDSSNTDKSYIKEPEKR